jgi:hypothetical protein
MGYNISIGQAEIEYDQDLLYMTIGVENATHVDAPDHDPFTGNGNSRSPSYTTWSDFCKDAGITELFYGQGWSREDRWYRPCSDDFHRETPILRDHPGAQPINEHDVEYVQRKLADYKELHPDAIPGFWDYGKETDWKVVDNGTDPVLARFIWLEFWMDWAVKNCKQPVIANT